MRNQSIPLFNQFYADDTRPFSQQDVCNWLPCTAEVEGTRTPTKLKTPPGLSPLVTFVTVEDDPGPVRLVYVAENRAFAVAGRDLYQINADLTKSPRGVIPGVGRVRASHNQITNGNEVLFVNGTSGYVWNTVTEAFAQVTDDGFPGAIDVVYIDGFFIVIEPGRRFAASSRVASALEWNTQDRFTSEVAPDLMVGMAVSNNELLILNERTGEFFENTGAAIQPFQSKRISFQRGCAGRYTIAQADNTVAWLGDNGMFYALNQYSPQRISNRAVEQAIKGSNWAQAFAEVWEDNGHTVVYWTFPDGQTWGYDFAEREWHRRESYGLNRWRVSSMAYWQNRYIAGDFQTARVWELDWDYAAEGDKLFVSSAVGPVMHDDQSLVLQPLLEVVMDTGMPANEVRAFPGETPADDFDADDAGLRMEYCDDGDTNFDYGETESIGLVGEYGLRVRYTRLGRFRQRVFRISCASPRRRDVLGAVAQLIPTQG